METHEKLQMHILIEAPMRQKLSALLDAHGVSGYTIFPALSGKGGDGNWSRIGQITDIGQMVLFVCILDRARADVLLNDLSDTLADHIGYVTTSEVQVIRPNKFS